METVLVTGGAGFIGSHVCDALLREGFGVIAVDDLSTGRAQNLDVALRHPAFELRPIDVRDRALDEIFAARRPVVAMHLAAQAGVRPSLEDPIHDASLNVIGLLNVLRCANSTGAAKVVYAASGGTIYGDTPAIPVTEDARYGSVPISPYGISKKVAEDYLRFYRRAHGMDYAALALGNVYGPRQDPNGEAGVIAIFGARLLAGRAPVIFGDGSQTRDYVYVEDVANAFVLAVHRVSGTLVNIGSGRETSVNELYESLSRLTGCTATAVHASAPAGEVDRISLDPSKAAESLGWRASTDLDDGLARTVQWLRAMTAAHPGGDEPEEPRERPSGEPSKAIRESDRAASGDLT